MQVTNHYQFNSEEVITPFFYQSYNFLTDKHYPGQQRSAIDSIADRTANYTDYDLFCFNSKLEMQIQTWNPDLSHRLVPKEYQGKIFLFVELLYGYSNLPISKEMQEKLQTAVTECYKLVPGKFLFFSTKQAIPIRGLVLPSYWLRSVIPLLSLPEVINYNQMEIFSLQAEFYEGNLYLALDGDTNYTEDANQLKLKLLEYLHLLYVQGTVALPKDSPLIKDWSLKSVLPGLYTAKWNNFIFAKEKTPFLLSLVYGEKDVSFLVPENEVVRHHLAKEMTVPHLFLHDTMTAQVTNLEEALQVSYAITRSLKHQEGEVFMTPAADGLLEEKEGYDLVQYTRIDRGRVNSYLR